MPTVWFLITAASISTHIDSFNILQQDINALQDLHLSQYERYNYTQMFPLQATIK